MLGRAGTRASLRNLVGRNSDGLSPRSCSQRLSCNHFPSLCISVPLSNSLRERDCDGCSVGYLPNRAGVTKEVEVNGLSWSAMWMLRSQNEAGMGYRRDSELAAESS